MATALDVRTPSPPAIIVIDVERFAPKMSSIEVIVAKAIPACSHLRYITIAVLAHKRGHSITIARSHRTRRQNTASEPATKEFEDEEVLNVTEAAESLHLSIEAVATQEAFLHAMETVCCIYTKNV